MEDAINHLHDATLISIRLYWAERRCELLFAGAPEIPGPFALEFNSVSVVSIPSKMPWGPSDSVLEVDFSNGVAFFVMQSGDSITVMSSDYLFKRMPPNGVD